MTRGKSFECPVQAEVKETASECLDGAKIFIAVCLLVNANFFPAVLLVVQFHPHPVRRDNEMCQCISWQASELFCQVFLEGDVFKFELYCLFGFVASVFDPVFPNA
jgi:hypothetical protein